MNEIAENIVKIIKDFEGDGSATMNVEHVLKWVNQFEEDDRLFLLTELEHILKQTYFSKSKILDCIFNKISFLAQSKGYRNDASFLVNAIFIATQDKEKSQTEILNLFYDALPSKYNIEKKHLGSKSKKYIIYFDDVLATGKTTFDELKIWLNNTSQDSKKYFELLKFRRFDLIVFTLSCHEWGRTNIEYQIKYEFGEEVRKRIEYHNCFCIENNPYDFNPKLNFVYPVNQDKELVNDYFQSIHSGSYPKHEKVAFRKNGSPNKETFFTSPENRIRYENILLDKGIDILGRVESLKSKQIRPLGYTVLSHKTFGLGTQYFTWRNISNTNPLVFWWKNHGWYPLFPVKNRGQN